MHIRVNYNLGIDCLWKVDSCKLFFYVCLLL